MTKIYKHYFTFFRFMQFAFFGLAILLAPKEVFALAKNLKAPKNSKIKKEKVYYGKTKTGNKLYAIRMYKEDHKLPMRPAAILTGGIHGNEYMGLVTSIASEVNHETKGFKDFFNAGGVLYFFPELNPDGVSKGNRFNSHGVDLNRDFKMGRRPSQIETASMVEFLEKDLDNFHARLILAMDYHCCSKSLIHPQLKNNNAFYKGQFDKIVGLMKTHVDSTYTSGVTKDIFGYETHGTLKGYWYKKFGALSFTYEGAHPAKEIKKAQGHFNWWKDLMALVVDVYDNRLAELTPQWEAPAKTGEAPAYYTE